MDSVTDKFFHCAAIQLHTEYDKVQTQTHNLNHQSINGIISLYDVSSVYHSSSPSTKPFDLSILETKCKVIAQLKFTCHNRFTGSLHLQLIAGDTGILMAEMKRNNGPNLFHEWEKEIPIFLVQDDMSPIEFAKYYPSLIGHEERLVVLGDKTEFSRVTPKWQGPTKALCCAFLLFFPTFAIGSCIMFCIASKLATYSQVYCTKGDTKTRLKDYALLGDALVAFDSRMTAKDKLGLILYGCTIYVETVIQPPKNNQGTGLPA